MESDIDKRQVNDKMDYRSPSMLPSRTNSVRSSSKSMYTQPTGILLTSNKMTTATSVKRHKVAMALRKFRLKAKEMSKETGELIKQGARSIKDNFKRLSVNMSRESDSSITRSMDPRYISSMALSPTIYLDVFGMELILAVKLTIWGDDIELPTLVLRCIQYLDDVALKEEGLYRIPGSTTKITELRELFAREKDVDLLSMKVEEPHAVAGLLKAYLRALPESVMTDELRPLFLQITMESEMDNSQQDNNEKQHEKLQKMTELIELLPMCYYTMIYWLIGHLSRVSCMSHINKMCVNNLSLIFSACLDLPAALVKYLIIHYDAIFGIDEFIRDYKFISRFQEMTPHSPSSMNITHRFWNNSKKRHSFDGSNIFVAFEQGSNSQVNLSFKDK